MDIELQDFVYLFYMIIKMKITGDERGETRDRERGGGRDGEVLITGEHERMREEQRRRLQRGRLIRREKMI
jgi:hypothetical protein